MSDSTPTLERAKSIANDAYAKEGPRKAGETHGHHVLRVAARAALDASGNDALLEAARFARNIINRHFNAVHKRAVEASPKDTAMTDPKTVTVQERLRSLTSSKTGDE